MYMSPSQELIARGLIAGRQGNYEPTNKFYIRYMDAIAAEGERIRADLAAFRNVFEKAILGKGEAPPERLELMVRFMASIM